MDVRKIQKHTYIYIICIYIVTYIHIYFTYKMSTEWKHVKFRKIRVLYTSLRLVDAKNAEEKSQVRIVYETDW